MNVEFGYLIFPKKLKKTLKRKKTSTGIKKPKKRKRHYKTGVYISKKCIEPVMYRSGWELVYAKYLDLETTVKSFTYESFSIPYVANFSTGKIRKYIPDFLVEYIDGKQMLVEIKRDDKLTNKKVQKKYAAAKVWCGSRNIIHIFVTSKEIELIKKTYNITDENDT